jgi:hypothetical protein
MISVHKIVCVFALLSLFVAPAWADWPNSVVKWGQPGTDDYGGASWIDDQNGAAICADDFLCTSTSPVIDIHFGGFSQTSTPNQFRITFWSDVPKSPNDESHPGELLYDQLINPADPNDPLKLGWQHMNDYDYSINLPQEQWFHQEGTPENPIVYWIGIQGVMPSDGLGDNFYWFFRNRNENNWGDDAAFASDYFGYTPWYNWGFPSAEPGTGTDLYDGPFPTNWYKSADMNFTLTTVPEPGTLVLLGIAGLGLILVRRFRR